jgi:hypothetical protein
MKARFLLPLISLCAPILGCDETVKTTILDGLQTGSTDVVTSLITALFLTLSNSLDITTAAMLDSASTLTSLLY